MRKNTAKKGSKTVTKNKNVNEGIDKATMLRVDPERVVIVGLDTKDGDEHPLYDPRIKLPLDPFLVANIRENGVILAIKVVKGPDGRYYVHEGRRRVIHAREANRQLKDEGQAPLTLGAIVESATDAATLFARKEAANRYRVTDDPITTAKNMFKLLGLVEGDTQRVATTYGVTDQTVRDYLAFLGLAPEVQAAMREGWLKQTAALMIARIPDQSAQKEVLDEVKQEKAKTGKTPSVANVAKKAQDKRAGRTRDHAPSATPSERVKKATEVLRAIAEGDPKGDALIAAVSKLCAVITDLSLDKLAKAIAKERAEAKTAAKGGKKAA